jgi:Mg2+ and Co2+ transporter CorA
VIEQLENCVPGKKIAEEFGIDQETVSDIKKQKESMKTYALKFEHIRTMRDILIKERQQRSVQTKLDSFFKPALLHSKRSATTESSMDE